MSRRGTLLVAALLGGSLAAPCALAQHGGGMHGGGFPGGGPGGPGMRGDMARRGDLPPMGMPNAGRPGGPPPHGVLQLGPLGLGRWWDDKHFAKDLKLRPDQQHRMDGIFEENRPTLARSFEAMRLEEDRMDTLVHSRPVDESALFQQIDRLEQARADLEKVSAHYLLQIRGEMDLNQISRLEQQR